jgi:hypothetical protein
MKKLLLIGLVMIGSLTGCNNNKELERRVAALEERMANMDKTSNTGRPEQNTPANANIVSTNNNTDAVSSIKFTESDHDFGTIKEGTVAKHTFKFTNNGTVPLVIQSATASCGCTVPKKPEGPINPGETSEIQVAFDSKGKPGMQNKTITITANTNPPTTLLNIKANVLPVSDGGPVK